jgi:hypothetical protein
MRYLRVALIYVPFALVAIARNTFGGRGEPFVIGGLLLACLVSVFVVWRRDRTIRRTVATLPLNEQVAAIGADPDVRDAAAGDVFGNERQDRMWQFTRWVGPWLAFFYPSVLYWMAAGERANGLVVMGLAVVGIVIWRFLARHYVRHYRCPTCGARPLPAVSLRPVRYVCLQCATTWRL